MDKLFGISVGSFSAAGKGMTILVKGKAPTRPSVSNCGDLHREKTVEICVRLAHTPRQTSTIYILPLVGFMGMAQRYHFQRGCVLCTLFCCVLCTGTLSYPTAKSHTDAKTHDFLQGATLARCDSSARPTAGWHACRPVSNSKYDQDLTE